LLGRRWSSSSGEEVVAVIGGGGDFHCRGVPVVPVIVEEVVAIAGGGPVVAIVGRRWSAVAGE
jgi:hypothetical protein